MLAPLAADLQRARLACGRPAGLVLPRPRDGQVWREHDWKNWGRRHYADAIRAVGGPSTPYKCRHAFASLLLAEGKTLAEVAAQIGDTVQTTSDTYVHVIAELRGQGPVKASDEIRAARRRVESEGVRKVFAALKLAAAPGRSLNAHG